MKKKNIICIICIDFFCENEYNMLFIFNVVILFNIFDRCFFKYEFYRRFKIIYILKMYENIFNNEISVNINGRKCKR